MTTKNTDEGDKLDKWVLILPLCLLSLFILVVITAVYCEILGG